MYLLFTCGALIGFYRVLEMEHCCHRGDRYAQRVRIIDFACEVTSTREAGIASGSSRAAPRARGPKKEKAEKREDEFEIFLHLI